MRRPPRTSMLQLPPGRSTILALPHDRALATRLGALSECAVMPLSVHQFPDGETNVQLVAPPLRGDVAILSALRDPDQSLLPVLLLAGAARQWGASRVGLVAPYLPYMRQDTVFRAGEAITARSFAQIISASFDWMMTIDPHLHRIQRLNEIFGVPARALHATPALAQWIKRNVHLPLIIGPDEGSRQWANDVAALAGAPSVVLSKTRHGDADITLRLPAALDEFPGRTPVLVDDIISTGTTMASTVSQLIARGFAPPVCVSVHAVFAPGAIEAIEHAGARCVVSTNTLPHITNQIDIVPLLASAVSRHTRRTAALASR
jgi:ribose-phosphate pyrophosphokinase